MRPGHKAKFTDYADRCVMLGYAEGTKGYRLWHLEKRKIIISRDVRFNETCFPFLGSPGSLSTADDLASHDSLDAIIRGGSYTTTNDWMLGTPRPDPRSDQETESVPVPAPATSPPDQPMATRHATRSSNGVRFQSPEEKGSSPAPRISARTTKGTRKTDFHTYVPLVQNASLADDDFDALMVEMECLVADETEQLHLEYEARIAETIQLSNITPVNLRDAKNSPDAELWTRAMKEELDSHEKRHTWTETNLRPYNVVGSKWVFKLKKSPPGFPVSPHWVTRTEPDGTVLRFKARLVAQGFSQARGVDYHETWAPVASYKAIRAVLATSAAEDLDLDQMDVTTAIL